MSVEHFVEYLALVPHCLPQIPHDMIRARTPAVAAESRHQSPELRHVGSYDEVKAKVKWSLRLTN
jgi:hypothetical protein